MNIENSNPALTKRTSFARTSRFQQEDTAKPDSLFSDWRPGRKPQTKRRRKPLDAFFVLKWAKGKAAPIAHGADKFDEEGP